MEVKLCQTHKVSPVAQHIILYLFLNMLIENLGLLNVTDQNVFRRLMHMFNRLSVVSNTNFIKPFCTSVKSLLAPEELERVRTMESLKLLDADRDFAFFTRKNTSTIREFQMSTVDQETISNLIRSLIPRVEIAVGAPVYEFAPGTCAVYRYYGGEAKHDWHVDPYNVDTTINVIICIGRHGRISEFQHRDTNGVAIRHQTFEGDAIVFRGGVTIHRVAPSKDPSSIRTVLSIAYSTDPCFKKPKMDLCNYFNGGKNRCAIATTFVRLSLVASLTYRFSQVDKHISTKTSLTIAAIAAVIARVISLLKLNIGTCRPVEIKQSIVILIFCILLSWSLKGGCLFFSYYILTDQLFDTNKMKYL